MNSELYSIIALGARYVFAAIMLLIVLRAWRITIVDSRRAASLRRLSPETGVCGEFLVLSGHGRVREGMRYPVIREGLVGSSRKADIRLRSSSVRRSHVFFELTRTGLRLRAQSSAKMYNAKGVSKREMTVGDGARVTIGQVELMLVLTEAVAASPEIEEARDDMFDVPAPPQPRPATAAPEAAVPWDAAPAPEKRRDVRPLVADDGPDDYLNDLFRADVRPETDEEWDDAPTPENDRWDEVWDEPLPAPGVQHKKQDYDPFDI